uniref:Restriction endonuclease type IV Mrr domain-containing protein n=1 Tax=Thermofilum pendens TaxID=2269 RepID=A0A7C4BB38_THEPE
MGARFRLEALLRCAAELLSSKGKVTVEEVSRCARAPLALAEHLLEELGLKAGEELDERTLPLLLIRAWMKGYSILDLALRSGWSTLEELVGVIFGEFGFQYRRRVRVKVEGKRYEVDVLAWRGDTAFCVDCKRWARLRESALRRAAQAQVERCRALARCAASGCVEGFGTHHTRTYLYPAVVSLHKPRIPVYEGVLLIDLYTLVYLLKEVDPLRLAELGAEPLVMEAPGEPPL